jgi:oxaloacetate decarboxylase (Na+ extruding) subunit alpha
MGTKKVEFYDTTLRDGVQSLWAMKMTYGIHAAVVEELDKAGYSYIEIPVNGVNAKHQVRFLKENPWDYAHLFGEKIKKTKKSTVIMDCLSNIDLPDPRSIVRMYYEMSARITKTARMFSLANTRNELDRHFPWVVPIAKNLGVEWQPCICYYPSPRATDKYYANMTKQLMAYEPDSIWLKDAGGLMTAERVRTLLPAIQKEAKGIPIEIHTHGVSTNQGRVIVEAMKLGVNGVHTCVPPLASGPSHISIYNAMHNAKVLGIEHNITDVEAIEEVERRLKIIAKLEDLPEGIPLEYDHGVYTHQIPGGVISNLKEQLGQLRLSHKLDEILEEVPRIIKELGYPMMITPMSQFVVSQATVNVSTGERYKEVLDPMIEIALGVWGWEDAGVPWMDPNIKDRFLSHPNARVLKENYDKREAMAAEEGSVNRIRASYGMTHASDEDFMLYHIMKGDEEIKRIKKPYKSYYTGKEPLGMLLKELSKDHDVSRLTVQKGNSFFEFKRPVVG